MQLFAWRGLNAGSSSSFHRLGRFVALLILIAVEPIPAAAQSPVQVELSVHGGVMLSQDINWAVRLDDGDFLDFTSESSPAIGVSVQARWPDASWAISLGALRVLESERIAKWRCVPLPGSVCPAILVQVPAAAEITTVTLDARLDLNRRSALIRPYVALGVGLGFYDLEWQGGGQYVGSSGSLARTGWGPRAGFGAEWSWPPLTGAFQIADHLVWFDAGGRAHHEPVVTAALSLRVH